MFEAIKLSDLKKLQIRDLRPPAGTRPAIRLIEADGKRAVVKDYSSMGIIFRNTAGRFLVWREKKAYAKLKGLRGIPALYRVIDGLALVFEEIIGRNLEKLEKELILPERFFNDLEVLIVKAHERGVVHCDLKRAPNTLVGDDGHPYIIDWAASISRPEFRIGPLKRVYERFLQDDFNAVTKLKLRHLPEKITPAELHKYKKRSKTEKIIRAVRDKIRKTLQEICCKIRS